MNTEGFMPASLEETLDILNTRKAIPIAGGTDLMVRHRRHGPLPIALDHPPVFIGHLDELRGIRVDGSSMVIGSATTLSELLAHPEVPAGLAAALREFASPAIRNIGTLGGNICNASPAGDTLPYLYVADAKVELQSVSGSRTLQIGEFITGPGQTAGEPAEVLTSVQIPLHRVGYFFYRKVAPRRSNALSKLSVYAQSGIDQSNGHPRVRDVRVAVGAVAPTVVRIPDAEARLNGATAEELRERAAGFVTEYESLVTPIDDQRSTAIYRRNTALSLIGFLLDHELPTTLEQL